MKFVHVNSIHGLIVEYNGEHILIQVSEDNNGTLTFDFRNPYTDVAVTDVNKARDIITQLMTETGGVDD